MRTLKFIVDGLNIKRDPFCDFSGLVPGTEQYLKAEFSFSSEWNGVVKAATFWSALGKEYDPQVLKDGVSCIIPKEALKKRIFKIRIVGFKDGVKTLTNKVVVTQNGGKE